MAKSDPAAGIKEWEEKFWSGDGLLNGKLAARAKAKVGTAMKNAERTAEERGMKWKSSASSGSRKPASRRKSTQRKSKQGK